MQRHGKNVRSHKGENVTSTTDTVLSSAYKTVSTSKRTAATTGFVRVIHTKHHDHAAPPSSGADSGDDTSSRSPERPRRAPSCDPETAGGARASASTGASGETRFVSQAERVLGKFISRIGKHCPHMTAEIMPEDMPEATRRSYQYPPVTAGQGRPPHRHRRTRVVRLPLPARVAHKRRESPKGAEHHLSAPQRDSSHHAERDKTCLVHHPPSSICAR